MVLGWREWVVLPHLQMAKVKAKLDTGARSSALHVEDLEPFRKGGRPWVRFRVMGGGRKPRKGPIVTAPVHDERVVKSSFGREQERFVITTIVDIAGWQWPIDLTLTSRSDMKFRMLLGRQAMTGRILVDPHRSYLAGRPGKRKGDA